jgi:hypothetical protein
VTVSAAILALALLTRPPLSLTREVERLNLPASAQDVRLEPRPFTREWILHVSPGAVAATVAKLERSSRLCPEVLAGVGTVTLRCTSPQLYASVAHEAAGTAILMARLSVPPWRPEDEGPPLVPFDLVALGLGSCPGAGKGPEIQGECALEAGDYIGARRLFLQAIAAGPSALARLRLGDLALRDDDPDAAVVHWRLAREAPWGRLASARLCELEPKCLASDAFEAVYDTTAVDHALRADLVLRRARLAALGGQLLESSRKLAAESAPGGACQANLLWCRRMILRALELSGPAGTEALVSYLELYARRDGPLALELTRAAALQAERSGAPSFAANMLGATTGTIPPDELEAHLQRVAELYLEAGDRARADEIVRYARSRLGEAAMKRPIWAALRRGVRVTTPAEPAPAAGPDPDIAAAQAAVQAARLVTAAPAAPQKKGATP